MMIHEDILNRKRSKLIRDNADILIDANTYKIYKNKSDLVLDETIDFEKALMLLSSNFIKVAIVYSEEEQDLIVENNFEDKIKKTWCD